jgi:hypothetical protein
MHSSMVMSVQRWVTVLNFLDRLDKEVKFQVLGHKNRETWLGLIMDFAANLLSSSTPTHTHDFDNHNNCYGRSKTSLMQSFSGLPEIRFFDGLNSETVSESMRITTFKIAALLNGLVSLMICTHNLTILTKTKEIIRYCELFGYGAKMLSTYVSIILTHVSVLAEDIKHILKGSSTFMPTHAPSRPALACPIMPIMDQHFRAHSSPTNYSQTTIMFINNKRSIHSPNISTKASNNKINSPTRK